MFFYWMIPPKWLKCITRLTARKQLNLTFLHLSSSSSPFSNGLHQNRLMLSPWLLYEPLSMLCAQCLLLPECSYCGDSTREAWVPNTVQTLDAIPLVLCTRHCAWRNFLSLVCAWCTSTIRNAVAQSAVPVKKIWYKISRNVEITLPKSKEAWCSIQAMLE